MNSQGKKHIALINFHFAHNYGAVLESLSLKTILEKLGYSVQVVDYQPYYQKQYYIEYPNPFKAAYWRFKGEWDCSLGQRLIKAIKWGLVTVRNYKFSKQRHEMKNAFYPFVRKHFNLTEKYDSLGSLKKNPPIADIYICGSDQIWNPKVTFGLDPAYYLDFGSSQVTRVAYAISPCAALDTYFFKDELSKLLVNFKAISLREVEKKEELEDIYRKPIDICIDPTLLLEADDFRPFEEDIKESERYILVYAFTDHDNTAIKAALNMAKEKYNLKVIDISYEKIDWTQSVERKYAVTPGEFLSLFKNASFIVTNSFHGTAFSIIYQKQFVCVPKKGTEHRMIELMRKLGAGDNLIIDNFQSIKTIDYVQLNYYLANYRNESMRFLKQSLIN